MACTAIALPAQAQLAPGYSGQSSAPIQGTQDEFYWSLNELGRCLAKSRKREARALVMSSAGSPAEATALKAMIGRPTMCVRGASMMGAPTWMIRGAIAEGLLHKLAAPLLAPIPPPPRRRPAKGEMAGITPQIVLADFTDCLAAAHPAEARALLAAPLGGKAETAAVSALVPGFDACLPPKFKIAFSAAEIRLGMSEAMFRRAAAAPSPVGVGR